MSPDVSALSACCRAAQAATNGHHPRWAIARCVSALAGPGVPPASPAIDEACARAAYAVGQVIQRRAAGAQVSPP